MTDDTDTDERGDADGAVSLPLIDTFAALEAALDAKTDRIEHLETELDRRNPEPDADAHGQYEGHDDGDDAEPRTPEDWEPATDPLEDTGTATAADDHEGVTPSMESGSEPSAGDDAAAESDPTAADATEDAGLAPVRTASAGGERPATADEESIGNDERPAPGDEKASGTEEEHGLEEEPSALAGWSLGRSAATAENDADAGSDDVGSPPDPTADRGERLSRLVRRAERLDEEEVVDAFVEGIEALDDVTRAMLAHYREVGDAAPVDAHVAAGGSGERRYAYARNRTLRKAGVIEHDGADRYRYALPDLVAEAFDGSADDGTVDDAVEAIEAATDLD